MSLAESGATLYTRCLLAGGVRRRGNPAEAGDEDEVAGVIEDGLEAGDLDFDAVLEYRDELANDGHDDVQDVDLHEDTV